MGRVGSEKSGPAASKSGPAASKSGPAGAMAPAGAPASRARGVPARPSRAGALAGDEAPAGAIAPAGPDFEAAGPDFEAAGPDFEADDDVSRVACPVSLGPLGPWALWAQMWMMT